MGFFDTQEGVSAYIKMVENYDPHPLIEKVKSVVSPGATLLEIGMGPGRDFTILKEHFNATGSDSSQVFVDRYLESHPGANVVKLDGVSLDTVNTYDTVFSNKVLQHFTTKELLRSFSAQHRILNRRGYAIHTLWYGDRCEEHQGLRFQYYTETTIRPFWEKSFELVKFEKYQEDEADDSFLLILKKK